MEGNHSSTQELYTPEALRRETSSIAGAPTRPGEKSPSKSRSSDAKPPSKMRDRLRHCGHCLSFVPWWALLSLALLVGGLTIFVLKANKASDAATALLAAVAGDTATGWPQFMSIYKDSVWPTVGEAGAAIAALVFAASVRLDQKLRKVGKYGGSKGSYGKVVFGFYTFLSWLGLVLLLLLALWSAVVGVLLASWAAQCWNLETGADLAATSIVSLGAMGARFSKDLEAFATTVLGSAGNLTAQPQLNATVTRGMASLQEYALNFTEPATTSTTLQQQGQDGLCASVGCLNMAMYPFAESTACVCTTAAAQSVRDLAKDCNNSALWALIAVAGLFAGAVCGSIELSADRAMLSADQLFLAVMKRKASRSSSRGSARREEIVAAPSFNKMLSPAASLPGKGASSPFTVSARA